MAGVSLESLARRQAGVFGRQQVIDRGYTPRMIHRRLAAGTWLRLLPSVYALAVVPLGWTSWAWAAVLAAGPPAVLAGDSAAVLWQWQAERWPVTVAVPVDRRVRWPTSRLSAVRLAVPDGDALRLDGLPCTTRLRTGVDVAHLLPLHRAQPLIDRALVLGALDLASWAEAVSRSRRHGSAQARRLARSATDGAASQAERLAHQVFRAAGLVGWQANFLVRLASTSAIVDIAFPSHRIAVEIDGWAFHATPERRARDEARRAGLQLQGWLVLTFSWWDLTTRPEHVVATVRAALAARPGERALPSVADVQVPQR